MKQLSLFAKKAKRLVALTATIAALLTSSIVAFGAVAEDDWTADMGACAVEDLFGAFNTGAVTLQQVNDAIDALNLAITTFDGLRVLNPDESVGFAHPLNALFAAYSFGPGVANSTLAQATGVANFQATGGFAPSGNQLDSRRGYGAAARRNVFWIMRTDNRNLCGCVHNSLPIGHGTADNPPNCGVHGALQDIPVPPFSSDDMMDIFMAANVNQTLTNPLNFILDAFEFAANATNLSGAQAVAVENFQATGGFSPTANQIDIRKGYGAAARRNVFWLMRTDGRNLCGCLHANLPQGNATTANPPACPTHGDMM